MKKVFFIPVLFLCMIVLAVNDDGGGQIGDPPIVEQTKQDLEIEIFMLEETISLKDANIEALKDSVVKLNTQSLLLSQNSDSKERLTFVQSLIVTFLGVSIGTIVLWSINRLWKNGIIQYERIE